MGSLKKNKALDELSHVSISKFISKVNNIEECYRFDIGLPRILLKDIMAEEKLRGLLEATYLDYAPAKGILKLRKALSENINSHRKSSYISAENIVVTCGSIGGLYAAFKAILNYGDKVLVPLPAWGTYNNVITINGGQVVNCELNLNAEYLEFDIDKTVSSITGGIKAVIINNPHNPTGKLYSAKCIQSIIEYAVLNDIYVFMDEAYSGLEFEKEKSTEYPFLPNLIYFRSFSKYYMVPGLRLGYVYGNNEIIENVNTVNHIMASNIDKAAQYIGLELLTGRSEIFEKQKNAYLEWGKLANEIFSATNDSIKLIKPQGTYYIFAELNNKIDVNQYWDRLANEYRTIVLPGWMFGANTANYIRLSMVEREDKIEKGLRNIASCALEMIK